MILHNQKVAVDGSVNASEQLPVKVTERRTPDTSVVVGASPSQDLVSAASQPSISLEHLLKEHIKATQFGELNTVMMNGTAMRTSKAIEVSLMARRPNLYKLKTQLEGSNFMSQFGYDGQIGWFKQNELQLTSEYTVFFMGVALFESSIAHLVWSYQSDEVIEFGLDSVLERLPDEQWEGRDCAVVVSHSLLPFSIFHYIDLDTYEEVYRRAQVLRGSELVDIALKFAAPDVAASPRIPMGYELFIDGALYDTVRYTRGRANRTILSSLFDMPKDADAKDLLPRR